MVRLVARLLDESRLTPRTGLADQILPADAFVNTVGVLYKVEEVEPPSRGNECGHENVTGQIGRRGDAQLLHRRLYARCGML